ncbi:MAG: amidohydrolase [Chitinophagaceae bacterium]|nr:amidohydrolase [Chitinophagaceae bacterium]
MAASLSITLVQTHLYWEDKTTNLQQLTAKLDGITGAEVVVLPEMFNTGFSMRPQALAETMEGPTMQWMKAVAMRKKIILTGSLMIAENGHYFNRMVWMLPNGQCGYYDKRHLFAYAGEDEHYTAGQRRLVAQVNGWRLLLLVCYDLRFPVWSRQQTGAGGQPEYDAIVYVANWPERRSHAWGSLLVARAIENQCYVVGVNRIGTDGNGIAHSGHSLVADPMGQVLYEAAAGKEEIQTLSLSRQLLHEVREKLPFLKDADHFTL